MLKWSLKGIQFKPVFTETIYALKHLEIHRCFYTIRDNEKIVTDAKKKYFICISPSEPEIYDSMGSGRNIDNHTGECFIKGTISTAKPSNILRKLSWRDMKKFSTLQKCGNF